MALLDVTDILADPDFMDELYCERSSQVVGSNGIAVNTTKTLRFNGVVTADKGNLLDRIETGERISGSITIHSKFRLTDGKNGFTADIVTFNGLQYTVAQVFNYSNYGRGFVSANCDLVPFAG